LLNGQKEGEPKKIFYNSQKLINLKL